MGRRLTAALWLFLLLTGQAATLARPLAAAAGHECRCDERLCRCTHQHRPPSTPKCHFPGGSSLPTLQSCDRDEEQVLATAFYVLPQVVVLIEPLAAEALIPTFRVQVPAFFDEISPPPPRSPLA